MENKDTEARRFETPYHEAWDYISCHDCGSSRRIAKLVVSMSDAADYPFPVGECLKDLDSVRKALALDLITHYARHGKTEALRDIGNDIRTQFPSFVSLDKTACHGRSGR